MASGYSIASALEEDRRDIMATLEREPREKEKEKKPRRRSCSRSRNRGDTVPPQSLASAMEEDHMEILANLENEDEEEDKPRHASIAGITSRGLSFIQPPIRSMLDITTPFPPPRARGTNSAQASPTVETFRRSNSVTRTRSNSDATTRPVEFGPKALDKMSRYQFSSFLSNNPGAPSMPKRASQGSMNFPSAMASVVSGAGIDLSSFMGRGRGRNNSIAGTGIRTGQSKSRSPHSRFSLRSSSPSLNNRKIQLDNGRFIDSKEAIERLSDANLASSGGTLADLPKPKNRRDQTDNGGNNDSGRLEKDKSAVNGEEAVESSDDDNQSSDEEGPRGRRSRENSIDTLLPNEIAPGRPYTYSSLLDPEITVTSPGSDGRSRSGMADYNNSGINTPVDSDAEENMNDIKRAQKLSINLTEISSTPATKRCVRTLYRGDFPKMQQEALDDVRRVRKYLVATDLSPESQHALEWTIGTVLRDGDTLLAIYCVDEKKDIPQEEVDDSQIKASEGIAVQGSKGSGSTPVLTAAAETGPLGSSIRLGSPSTSASPAGRERSQMEQERFRLVQNITDRVSRLLRKTKLQVRVVIEVIHCKNAMHLITEVIDYISPTLVILGCRGRNALKSSLLGSFSNYVVTKSSVPVMVAKKKFKKHGKAKRPRVRLVNNLENPSKSLSDARID